ncbi:MAG: di-heme oxidoredictase family protein [Planctomycetota bacterium]
MVYLPDWRIGLAIALCPVVSVASAGTTEVQPAMGAPLSGLTADQVARFEVGRSLYVTPVAMEDGLGPIMNKSNCGSCHANPLGGWGAISVTRFGMEEKGVFMLYPGESQSLAQSLSISGFCAETIPADASIVRTRLTNSSMAFGLVEAIPDVQIAANADPNDVNGDGISGRVHWVSALEDPTGSPLRAGRFGWKAQVATVLTFSADAARNEMGLTNRFVPADNAPNGDTARLAVCDEVADPEDVLDANGSGFIDKVTDFQRFLAPPPQTPRSGMAGELLFNQVGCAQCHVAQFTTSTSASLEEAIRGKTIRPYSDFLLHDMGLLADGISDGEATELEMRTPVLWGLRRRDPMLHNGGASGGSFTSRVLGAIALHGPFGEAASSAAAVGALSAADKAKLVKFLGSLGRREFDFDGDEHVNLADFFALQTCLAQGATNPNDDCAVGDIDQNGLVNAADVEMFIVAFDGEAEDCNNNGFADLRDIALGVSQDSNSDGVPDECTNCLADLDRNGAIEGADLTLVLAGWGSPGNSDVNGDGTTNGTDLSLVLAAWGPCQ